MKEDIRNFTLQELERALESLRIEPYRARQVFNWLYKKGAEDFSSMKNLSQKTQEALSSHFYLERMALEKIESSCDLTQKFLFRLNDGSLIESVSIPFKSRTTACLSTQVGCRFSCSFCASGFSGFKRNLTVAEIISQFIAIRKNIATEKITNVVFMGVGEPLDNYDNLLKAIRIMNTELGINLGIRKMTISTCGLADAIERLAAEGLQVELSVSLHSAIDSKRSEILPINKKYPLDTLFKAVRTYIAQTKRKVTFEYILFGGYNTTLEDAQQLVRRLKRGIHAGVNLIVYNPVHSNFKFSAPAKLEVLFFKSYLEKEGIDVTLRSPRGRDIDAACGQLKARELKKKRS